MGTSHYWMSSHWSRIVVEVLVIVFAMLSAIFTLGISLLAAVGILMAFGVFWRLGDIAQNTERIANAIEEMVSKIDSIFGDEAIKNEQKGTNFERYVINLFRLNNKPDKEYFTVEDWTRDINRKAIGIKVNSDQNPDLTMCYNGKEYFAVECKYRADFYFSKERNAYVIKWSYPEQMKRYQQFQKEKNIPVFIVIGVGGSPTSPMTMYCLPLNEAKYPELYKSYLEKYKRSPVKPFFWKNNKLS